jgi:hypothetical protein
MGSSPLLYRRRPCKTSALDTLSLTRALTSLPASGGMSLRHAWFCSLLKTWSEMSIFDHQQGNCLVVYEVESTDLPHFSPNILIQVPRSGVVKIRGAVIWFDCLIRLSPGLSLLRFVRYRGSYRNIKPLGLGDHRLDEQGPPAPTYPALEKSMP